MPSGPLRQDYDVSGSLVGSLILPSAILTRESGTRWGSRGAACLPVFVRQVYDPLRR